MDPGLDDEELIFAKVLVKHGLLAPGRLRVALADAERHMRENGTRVDLVEFLLRKGYVNPAVITGGSSPSKGEETPAGIGERLGKFDVGDLLGRGGMGKVYRAWQRDLRRHVALKVLSRVGGESYPTASGSLGDRLLREAQAAAKLHHPNIVQVYEAGRIDDQPYIAMELVRGTSLKVYLAMARSRTRGEHLRSRTWFRTLARCLAEIADALHFAHSHAVIHQDIKPGNILVQFAEGELHRIDPLPPIQALKAADFGLAVDLARDLTWKQRNELLGTPAYMSPEQARGKVYRLMPASDIFSLGCVLYETFTGLSPFLRRTITLTIDAIKREDPVPPRKINGAVPGDLEAVILRCLAKEPWDRYGTCELVKDDLLAFAEGKLVSAEFVPVAMGPDTNRSAAQVPDDALAHYQRGVEHFREGNFKQALKDYKRCLSLEPAHVKAWVNRGAVLIRMGRVDEALACWSLAIDLEPTLWEAYLNRALILRERRMFKEAVADYSYVVKNAPRGRGLREQARKSREKARQMMRSTWP